MGPSGGHALAVYALRTGEQGGQAQPLSVLEARDSRNATYSENLFDPDLSASPPKADVAAVGRESPWVDPHSDIRAYIGISENEV